MSIFDGSRCCWSLRSLGIMSYEDQYFYTLKHENIIGLDSYILNSFSYFSPI